MQDLEQWCQEIAGNWQKFDSFAWYAQPDDAEQWAHAPLDNRDSDPLAQSNAECILDAVREADPAGEGERWSVERHSHWGVGWCRVLTFLVWNADGSPSAAAIAAYECASSLEEYGALDEEDYSRRESDVIQESWEWLSMRERMEVCQRAGLSFLAARHKGYPSEVYDELRPE